MGKKMLREGGGVRKDILCTCECLRRHKSPIAVHVLSLSLSLFSLLILGRVRSPFHRRRKGRIRSPRSHFLFLLFLLPSFRCVVAAGVGVGGLRLRKGRRGREGSKDRQEGLRRRRKTGGGGNKAYASFLGQGQTTLLPPSFPRRSLSLGT